MDIRYYMDEPPLLPFGVMCGALIQHLGGEQTIGRRVCWGRGACADGDLVVTWTVGVW